MNTPPSKSYFRKMNMEALCTRQLMAADIAMTQPLEGLVGIATEEAFRGEMISNPVRDPYAKGVKIDIDFTPGLNGQVVNNDQQIATRKLDIDRDDYVTSLDALILANDLNNPYAVYEKALDVNADGFVSSLDCLAVINLINFINFHNSQLVVGVESPMGISDWPEPIEDTTEKAKQDQEAGRAAIDFISALFHVKREDLVLERVSRVAWSDTSLGLGRMGFQAITFGHRALVRHGGILHEVRSSSKEDQAYGGYKLIGVQSQNEDPTGTNGSAGMADDSNLDSVEDSINSITSHTRIWTR